VAPMPPELRAMPQPNLETPKPTFVGKFVQRTVEAVTMFVVAGVSLLLLLYVGFGDGRRTFEQIQIEKLTAQGAFVQSSIEKFLRDDLPLKQYAGFSTLVAPILEGEDVDAVIAYDQAGQEIFSAVDKRRPALPEPPLTVRSPAESTVHHGETHYQVVLPLRSRFETVGSVVIVSPAKLVAKRLSDSFLPLLLLVGTLSVLFALLILVMRRQLVGSKKPWLQIAYGLTFLIMSVFVVGTLIGLYFDGVQGKAKASAFTLSQRLADILEFRVDIKDLDGVDRSFRDYRRLNPDISEAALLVDDTIAISTESGRVGKPWTSDIGKFEYRINLNRSDDKEQTTLAVTVLKSIVFERVWRSVKNFAALFIASAFLAGLFLQVATSVQRRGQREGVLRSEGGPLSDTALVFIKPVFFLAVFLDSLTYSFLPKFMQEAAVASGVSVGFASAPFTAYYLCFALILIPAGVFADRRGPKPVILLGLVIAAASVIALTLPLGIWEMTALRGVAGIGQGLLLIGVQSYILAVAAPEKRTQGAAIIVFGFQGGLISGMALGSLLVNFVHAGGVFIIAGGVGCATLLYSLLLLPRTERMLAEASVGAAVRKLAHDLKNVMHSLEFLKTFLCIGAPAKAILTGIITFALPLILGQAGYRPEDIGQFVMLYGLGVVVSTGYVSRLVDRTRNTDTILFAGATISGIGLVMIGFLDTPYLENGLLSTAVVVVAVLLVGVAHGLINAPVVTHVGQSALADRIGANTVTTAYRFIERLGHVAGPLLLSQLFLVWGQGAHIIGGIGAVVIVLGLIFLVGRERAQAAKLQSEAVE
jgi:MFS family permease